MMSGRLSSALSSVPTTKPSCTERVNHVAAEGLRCHSLVSAGTTAEPLNQSDIPHSSAIASSASVRQRDLSDRSGEGCKREIVAQHYAAASIRGRAYWGVNAPRELRVRFCSYMARSAWAINSSIEWLSSSLKCAMPTLKDKL